MPDGARSQATPLRHFLFEKGYHMPFFQAVHMLQNWHADGVRIGESGPPSRERLRFRPEASFRFPPGDIVSISKSEQNERQTDMVVSFMGLYGASAPTPIYFTELLVIAAEDAQPLIDFLDIFNHRLISLYYRAWLKYRFPYRYEPGAKDALSGHIFAFVGLTEPIVRPLTELPVQRLLRFVGLLAPQTRPPVNLERLLEDYYGGLPIRIREFMLRWVTIPPAQQNRLGSANSSLGVDLSVGSRVPDRDGKIRIEVGPVHYDDYLQMLPETQRFHDLCALVRLWSFERFDFDVEIEIFRREIPAAQLDPDSPPQLGRTTWVMTPEQGLEANPKIIFRRPLRAA